MKVELRERSFGELVGQSYSLAGVHFLKLALIIGILGLPTVIYQLLVMRSGEVGGPQEAGATAMVGVLVLLILNLILVPLQQGASVLLVASSFTGDNPTLADCFKVAFRRLGDILLLSIVVGLIVGFGFLLLIVPGLIFMTWYYVSIPALLVEKISRSQAMERSKSLGLGNRMNILGFAIVTTLLLALIGGFIGGLIGGVAGSGYTQILVSYVINVAFSTVGIVAPVVYYFNLRVKKEAMDIQAFSSLVEAIARKAQTAQA